MSNISSKATEHFESTQLLFQQGRYRDSVSRAYYAIYTAVEDYVGLSTTGTWTHRGIRGAFTAKMIHAGVHPQHARELSRKFADAFDARISADYSRQPTAESAAKQILGYAQEILDWIQKEMNP
ncbi:HEPN domain-containing protein [Candidatus Poribacteria bacterium]|nr:HEPN domain-containing protein [Candidatus Poribacteria bacterium]